MDEPHLLVFRIKSLSNQIKRLTISCASCHDEDQALTAMQSGIIFYLVEYRDNGDICQREVEEFFNIRRSTATGILKLMEKNGLIQRSPMDYDARLKGIQLTDKAMDIYHMVSRDIKETEARLVCGISQEDLKTFYRVLEQISDNIDL